MGRSNHDTPCENTSRRNRWDEPCIAFGQGKFFQLRLRSVKVDNQRILRSQQMANIIPP